MSQKFITLPIPDELYERLQETAEVSARSPEQVLVESLEDFFRVGHDLPSLEALADYSNLQLWRVVLSGLSAAESARLHELNEKNQREPLTETEAGELDQLLKLVDRYMLQRSEALLLLKQRGQNIDSYLNLKLGA